MLVHHSHSKTHTNTDGTIDIPDIPNAIIVLCALILAFGGLAVVMLLCKHFAPSGVYLSKFFDGYKRLKHNSGNDHLPVDGEEGLVYPASEKESGRGWVERLVTVLVFFSADNLHNADMIIPVSEAEKLGTVEV
jgi:hypothetical protein